MIKKQYFCGVKVVKLRLNRYWMPYAKWRCGGERIDYGE